jgi:hypothetical protein
MAGLPTLGQVVASIDKGIVEARAAILRGEPDATQAQPDDLLERRLHPEELLQFIAIVMPDGKPVVREYWPEQGH